MTSELVAMDKLRNKTSVKVTPAQRVAEFGKEKFCMEGGMLWCKICDVPVDHVRRQTTANHVVSKKHKTRLGKHEASDADRNGGPPPKRQSTLKKEIKSILTEKLSCAMEHRRKCKTLPWKTWAIIIMLSGPKPVRRQVSVRFVQVCDLFVTFSDRKASLRQDRAITTCDSYII